MPEVRKRAGFVIGLCAVLTACESQTNSCGKGGGSGGPRTFQITEYSMQFSEFFRADTVTGESSRPYTSETTIDPLDFALLLSGEVDWSIHANYSGGGVHFNWFAQVYACTPSPSQIPAQRLVSYEITSTANFADFPAGTELTPLFVEYSRAPYASLIYGNISADEVPPIRQTLRLHAIPLDEEHVFTVTIELDDGGYYQFVSPVVTFDLQE